MAAFIAIIVAAFATTVEAGTLKFRPGLWRTHVTAEGQPPQSHIECIAPDDIEHLAETMAQPKDSPNEKCKPTDIKATGNQVDWKYQCGALTEVSIKFDRQDHFSGVLGTFVAMMGRPMVLKFTVDGKRVGACTEKKSPAK